MSFVPSIQGVFLIKVINGLQVHNSLFILFYLHIILFLHILFCCIFCAIKFRFLRCFHYEEILHMFSNQQKGDEKMQQNFNSSCTNTFNSFTFNSKQRKIFLRSHISILFKTSSYHLKYLRTNTGQGNRAEYMCARALFYNHLCQSWILMNTALSKTSHY